MGSVACPACGHPAPACEPPAIDLQDDPEQSNLYQHARFELERAGLLSPGSDYNGLLGAAVLDLIREFSRQDHSGHSAGVTLELFNTLGSYKTLTPITSDPDEWMDQSYCCDEPTWQNVRRSTSFSRDGGRSWYDINDPSLNHGDVWQRQAIPS